MRSAYNVKQLAVFLILIFSLSLCLPGLATNEPALAPVHTDKYVECAGAKLHYVESGSGQAVVLLHGNDGTLLDFTMSIFDRLASKYRAIAFDRPGHGASHMLKGEKAPDPARQAQIIHAALLRLQIQHPILVAQSWSSCLALSYANQYPQEVSALVLLGCLAYDDGNCTFFYRLARIPLISTATALIFKAAGRWWVKRQLENAFSPDKAPQLYEEKFLKATLRVGQLRACANDELTINPTLKYLSPKYAFLNLPVVIVAGDKDRTVSPEKHSYSLHRDIPRSELIVLPDAGHEIWFTRSQEVLKAIDTACQMAKSWNNQSGAGGAMILR